MTYRFRFMARRNLFLALSGLLLLITVVSLLTRGLNFGIDFRGGVVIQITATAPTNAGAVRAALTPSERGTALIQQIGHSGKTFQIQLPPIGSTREQALETVLNQRFGAGKSVVNSVSLVSPVIGRELRSRAILAVVLATVLMTAFLGIRFQVGDAGSYSGLKFALAAVLALLHDLTLTVGLFSVFHLPVNSPFVAAVLTVYGYSMNDTIIVFDRIRERLQHKPREPLTATIDASVNQVLNRTITTVATVLLALLSVYFLGGMSTRDLALALLVGVSFGTYSSVFIASPILLWLLGDGDDAARSARRGRSVARGRPPVAVPGGGAGPAGA